jgi:hypothetical protein
MSFDAKAYGADVAAILALDGDGERLMPLAGAQCSSAEALAKLKATSAPKLFPRSRAPEAALAGLYLYFSCWTEAHEIAQDIGSPEGGYWHAIVHRQEPDDWNSAYWFRQAGQHPIFPALAKAASAIGIETDSSWDPPAFIELCTRARALPGSDLERQCLEVQRAEWQLLFRYCAGEAEQ